MDEPTTFFGIWVIEILINLDVRHEQLHGSAIHCSGQAFSQAIIAMECMRDIRVKHEPEAWHATSLRRKTTGSPTYCGAGFSACMPVHRAHVQFA
ncbi:MAG: hypothetical protein H0U16_01530 [Actinobacteria bacterium]|nr:hypothetical protein [Actinomycetota bacterium]